MSRIDIQIRTRRLVEAYRGDTITAKAYRADETSTWFVGVRDANGNMRVVAQVGPPLGEVLQRKAILALLKELA